METIQLLRKNFTENNYLVKIITSIFIVEDDTYLRILYEKALNLKGYTVLASAKNGKEAIDMFKSFSPKPDIIIMDHRMPLKNGLDTTKEMLEMDQDLKIIFISADTSVKNQALSIGAMIFTNKPCTIQDLYKDIECVLKFSKVSCR
ncbi:MAG: response regulator [Candidatus Lokiarchaeota archaeon]|nr:response regulator [Candidatus Lokiarchaeota archaeon]